MTLNITVAAARCIYQSADYRLVDLNTGRLFDFETQKIQVFTTFHWSATVCFAGVGRTNSVDVSKWLDIQLSSIGKNEPFETLIDKILEADAWLSSVPHPNNRHSFSVGAFIGNRPEFVLISNFEDLTGAAAVSALPKLMVHRTKPTRATTFVSGVSPSVQRPERRRLARLAARDPSPSFMYEVLAAVNKSAARRSDYVSEACFTTHVRLTGEGGGAAHGTEGHILSPFHGIPNEIRDVIQALTDEQFGPGGASLTGVSFSRSDPSDEYHATQLREKPNDANVHSNFGAYLKDHKADKGGAEQAYKKALALDPNHVNALGNLANLYWDDGNLAEAETLYRKALANQPGEPNVTWNFARFLDTQGERYHEIIGLISDSIAKHPDSGRLRLLLADTHLMHGAPAPALEAYSNARGISTDQAAVEKGYAFALQMADGANGECLAAYRLAVTLNPDSPELRLNFSQLLFISGDTEEARRQLGNALQLGLKPAAEIEAQFYRVCYVASELEDALTRLEALVAAGAQLNWNVTGTIRHVRQFDAARAARLEQLAEVLASNGSGRQNQIRRLLLR